MTTTVTVAASDFTGLGPIGASGAEFRFTRALVDVNSSTDVVTSTKGYLLVLDSNGAGSSEIPDDIAGNGVVIRSTLNGWATVTVAGYPVGTISLTDLVDGYTVDPATLEPAVAPPAWWTALDGKQPVGDYATAEQLAALPKVLSLATGAPVPAGTAAGTIIVRS